MSLKQTDPRRMAHTEAITNFAWSRYRAKTTFDDTTPCAARPPGSHVEGAWNDVLFDQKLATFQRTHKPFAPPSWAKDDRANQAQLRRCVWGHQK